MGLFCHELHEFTRIRRNEIRGEFRLSANCVSPVNETLCTLGVSAASFCREVIFLSWSSCYRASTGGMPVRWARTGGILRSAMLSQDPTASEMGFNSE